MAEKSATHFCAPAQPATIVTTEFRLVDPVHLLTGPYSITARYPKSNELTKLRELLHDAAVNKWGADRAAWPAQLRDLNFTTATEGAGWPITADAEGNLLVAMNSNVDFRPALVDQNVQPIYDRASIVTGCIARAEVGVWAYENDGRAGLGINLMKLQVLDQEAIA
jgi:hypothetical protein